MTTDNQSTDADHQNEEESIFDLDEFDTSKYYKPIAAAKRLLFGLAALQLFAMFFYIGTVDESRRFIVICYAIVWSVIFLFCALYSKKEPLLSLLVGLLVYTGLMVYYFIQQPTEIFNLSLLLKLMIIGILARGVWNAVQLKRIKETLGRD